jgi:hypothetical protein
MNTTYKVPECIAHDPCQYCNKTQVCKEKLIACRGFFYYVSNGGKYEPSAPNKDWYLKTYAPKLPKLKDTYIKKRKAIKPIKRDILLSTLLLSITDVADKLTDKWTLKKLQEYVPHITIKDLNKLVASGHLIKTKYYKKATLWELKK